jgi:hypothetical protein
VQIDGAFADPGLACEIVDRHLPVAIAGEQSIRGIKDQVLAGSIGLSHVASAF